MTEIAGVQEHLFSLETMVTLLRQVDKWNTRPSPFFPGYLEILKTRKDKDSNISTHINISTGLIRKFAGTSAANPTIQKEANLWETALEVFDIDKTAIVGTVRQLKSDPSRGWEEVKYLEMPYMGLPLSYFEKLSPGILPKESRDEFTNKMKIMVEKHGIIHPDLNLENVLVRVYGGEIKLFPIDWESADKRKSGIERKLDYYLSVQAKKCNAIFAKYYPSDYNEQLL